MTWATVGNAGNDLVLDDELAIPLQMRIRQAQQELGLSTEHTRSQLDRASEMKTSTQTLNERGNDEGSRSSSYIEKTGPAMEDLTVEPSKCD